MPFILTLYAQQVLGFSPVEFGLSSVVFPLTVAVAAITGQGLVLKVGFRPIAAAGFILLAGGSLYLAQVSPDGSYFGDIFLGLLISGLGTGFAFVTLSIAALAGVEEREAGLASGLNNTAFQIGAAIGTAIVSTVAVSRTDNLLGTGTDRLVALTEGFQSAFLACIVLAGAGLLFALLLPGRARQPMLEAVPEPVAD
jgi:predicted MFS family arabinose efflux permease